MADATTHARAPTIGRDGSRGVRRRPGDLGPGFGAEGEAVGELCFNTAMTGYQEVMTDPSYAKQVIAFTFPHIGNVGANDEDVEASEAHALGCLVREVVPSRELSREPGLCGLDGKSGRIGIAGIDTRALTRLVRTEGPPTIAIAHRQRANSTWRRFGRWRRTARARAWTSPRTSAGFRSSAGEAGNGHGGRVWVKSHLPRVGGGGCGGLPAPGIEPAASLPPLHLWRGAAPRRRGGLRIKRNIFRPWSRPGRG